MPRLIVRAQAESDVDEIAASIAQDNLTAALRFYDRAQETFDRIALWPHIGARHRAGNEALKQLRSYPIRGYRNYLVFYLPSPDGAEILHVIHGARELDGIIRA